MNPFNYCALAYADQWLGYDKDFCKILPDRNQPEETRLKTLHEALKFYRVTRNWKGSGKERFRPLLEVFDEINFSKSSAILDRKQIVEEVVKKLKEPAGKETFSLATKMLWIWFKQPFIIFDQNAAASLKLNSINVNTADEYYHKWESAFNKNKSDIEEACSQLPKQRAWLKYEYQKEIDNELVALSGELFFHHRVFDNFLWGREERKIPWNSEYSI